MSNGVKKHGLYFINILYELSLKIYPLHPFVCVVEQTAFPSNEHEQIPDKADSYEFIFVVVEIWPYNVINVL